MLTSLHWMTTLMLWCQHWCCVVSIAVNIITLPDNINVMTSTLMLWRWLSCHIDANHDNIDVMMSTLMLCRQHWCWTLKHCRTTSMSWCQHWCYEGDSHVSIDANPRSNQWMVTLMLTLMLWCQHLCQHHYNERQHQCWLHNIDVDINVDCITLMLSCRQWCRHWCRTLFNH
jgi:hypothetical protein